MPSFRSLLIPEEEDPAKAAGQPAPQGPTGGMPTPTGAPMPAPAGVPQQPPVGVPTPQPAPAPAAPPAGVTVKKRVAAPPQKSTEDIAREKLETILSPAGAKAGDRVKLENAQLAADIEKRTAEGLPNTGTANLNAPITSSPAMERAAKEVTYPELRYKPKDITDMPELLDSKRSKQLAGQFKMMLQTGLSASSVLKDLPDLPGGEQSSKLAKDALTGPQPRTEGGMLAEGMDPLAGVTGQINKQDIFSDAVRVARAIVGNPRSKQGQKDAAIQSIIGMSGYLNGDTDDPAVFTSAHMQLAGASLPTAKPDRGGVIANALGDNPIYKKFFASSAEKVELNRAELNKTFGTAARQIAGKWLSNELGKLETLATKGVYTGEGPESGVGTRTGVQKQAALLRQLLGGFKSEAEVSNRVNIASDNPFNTYITRRITAAFQGSKGVDKELAKKLAGMATADDSALKQITDMFGINKELQNISSFDFRGKENEFAAAADRAMILLKNGEDDKAAVELAPYMNKVQKRIFFPGVDIEVYGSTPNAFGIDTAEEVAARGIGDTTSRRTQVESNISNMQTALTKDKKREMTYTADPDSILLGVGRNFGIDTTTTLFGKRDVNKDIAIKNFDPNVAMEDLDQLLRVTQDANGVAYGDQLHDKTMNAMRGMMSKIDDRLKDVGKGDSEYQKLTEFKTFLTEKLDDASEMLDRSNSSSAGRATSPFFERLGSGEEADFTRPKEVTGKQRLAQGFDIIDAWVNRRGINASNYFSGVNLADAQVSKATPTLSEARTGVSINPVNAYGEYIADAPPVRVNISANGEAVIPVYREKVDSDGNKTYTPALDKNGSPLTQTVVIPRNERERFGFGTRTSSAIAGGLSGSRYGMTGDYIAKQARQMYSLIRSGLQEGAPNFEDRRKYAANLIGGGLTQDTVAGMSDEQFVKFLGTMTRDHGTRLLGLVADIDRQGSITGDLRASSSYNATSTRGKSKGLDERVVEKISRYDIGDRVNEDVSTAARSLLTISQTIDRNASPDDTPEQAAKKVQDIIQAEADKVPSHIRPEFIQSANRLANDVKSGEYNAGGIGAIRSAYADTLSGPAKMYWEKNSDIVPTRVVTDGQILISSGKGRGEDLQIARQRAGEATARTIDGLTDPANSALTTAFINQLDPASKPKIELILKKLKEVGASSDPGMQFREVLRDELNGMIKRGIKINPDTLTVDVPDYLIPSKAPISEAQLADEAREIVQGIKKPPVIGELDPKAQWMLDQKLAQYKLQKVITAAWVIGQAKKDTAEYYRLVKEWAPGVPADVLNAASRLNANMARSLGGSQDKWNGLGIRYDSTNKTLTGLNDPRFTAAFERIWKKMEPSIAAKMPPIKYAPSISPERQAEMDDAEESKKMLEIETRNKMSPDQRRKLQRAKATAIKNEKVTTAFAEKEAKVAAQRGAKETMPAPSLPLPEQSQGPKRFVFDSPLIKNANITINTEDRNEAKEIAAKLRAAKNKGQLVRIAKALGVTIDYGVKERVAASQKEMEAKAREEAEKQKRAEESAKRIPGLKKVASGSAANKAAAAQRTPPPIAPARRTPQPPTRPVQIAPTPTATPQPPRRPASPERSQGGLIRATRRGRGTVGMMVQAGQAIKGFAGKLGNPFGGKNATRKTAK